MLPQIIAAVARSLVNASVDRDGRKGTVRRAYYNWVIYAVASLPVAIFVFFIAAGLYNVTQGYNGWEVVLIGLAGVALIGGVMAWQLVKRSAEWSDKGVRFRWLTGEADLAWTDIEKIEIRLLRRNYARIRFRDGRTFGVSAQLTGGNALLRELQRRGVPVMKWGTNEPLQAQR
jgi:hypothetical protein